MAKIKAVVSYDGRGFSGFQRLKKGRSVQSELEKALSTLEDHPVSIVGAGRTDTGVSARGQVIHFETDKKRLDLERYRFSFNRLLPKDILVTSLEVVPDSFHARYSAKGKVYSYSFHLGDRNVFSPYVTQVEVPKFDLGLFEKALSLFKGTHRFYRFTSKTEDSLDFVRTIDSIDLRREGDDIRVVFEGDGFMTYMIRLIVGACFHVAEGTMSLKDIETYLEETDKKTLPYKAPAQGLCLEEVRYE